MTPVTATPSREPGAERPRAEEVGVKQRGTARAAERALVGGERQQGQRRPGEAHGPTVLAALDQR